MTTTNIPRERAHSTASQSSQGSQPRKPEDAKVSLLPGSTNQSAVFVFTDEDHTLGNALRHVAMQDDKVRVAAYSIPHPLENKMRVQIETTSPNFSATDALVSAIDRLSHQIKTLRDMYQPLAEQE
jgi:DNA-directed RNA polymerase subunit L